MLELEKAHVTYIARRDEWVQLLLPSKTGTLTKPARDTQHEHDECIRAIAELLWESAGRPEGTSEQDWHRAEEIVRMAGAAA